MQAIRQKLIITFKCKLMKEMLKRCNVNKVYLIKDHRLSFRIFLIYGSHELKNVIKKPCVFGAGFQLYYPTLLHFRYVP